MSVKEIQDGSVSKRRAYIILVAFIVTLLTTAYTSSYIAAACCSILLLGMLGIGHNFIHHKTNPFRHFYLPTGFTADEWQIMHCLSHHIYPNL